MSPRDRSPVRTSSPRQPSGKDHWNQWTAYTLTLLQLEQTTGSSGRRGTGPPPDWAWFLSRFFLRSVTDGVFVPCRCRLWLAQLGTLHFQHNHRLDCTDIINWTKLDNAITKFNNEIHSAENWVLNPVILHYWLLLNFINLFDIVQCFVTICIVKSAI